MNYWSAYNENLFELSEEIINHNKNNHFNFVEKNFYNHVRDIVSLTLILNSKKNSIQILDYGSNILTWSNIKNKINFNKFCVTIYDPFYENHSKYSNKIFDKLEIINDLKLIKNNKYDFTLFGSSSQYIEHFFDKLISQKELLSPTILFTHTPLSLSSQFTSKQLESKENDEKYKNFQGKQIIRSYKQLLERMELLGYDLIFKSTLDPKFARVEKTYEHKTVYANLLFKKKFPDY